MESWDEFYSWLKNYGYYVVEKSYIFRAGMLITDFDPVEDSDSGEIDETIERIKTEDFFMWKDHPRKNKKAIEINYCESFTLKVKTVYGNAKCRVSVSEISLPQESKKEIEITGLHIQKS